MSPQRLRSLPQLHQLVWVLQQAGYRENECLDRARATLAIELPDPEAINVGELFDEEMIIPTLKLNKKVSR